MCPRSGLFQSFRGLLFLIHAGIPGMCPRSGFSCPSAPPVLDPRWNPRDVPPERAFPVLPRPPVLDPRGHPRDAAVADGFPFFQLRSVAEHPKDHTGLVTDKPSEKALPAPLRPPVLNPSWPPRGTQRARYTSRRGKKSQKASDVLDKTVKKLVQIDYDPPAKSSQKKGSYRMPPVSDVERKAMDENGMPVVDSGTNTKAGSNIRERLYITMSSVVPMVLLSLRLTFLLGKLIKAIEKRKQGQADTATTSTGEDQTGDAGSRKEQNDTLTQEDEDINNGLSP
ncbi:uncharacterized protein LOC107320259 [Coturnix japonica]|uniref:uncharacterized protein LOC107320259 n=1 Tax=Coturnix japonica TaxID=93934 RepID=UPI000777D249|nr:uncharacterized protein LOC107320259 [Coturnix japonica]